jgi:hypothetical protein
MAEKVGVPTGQTTEAGRPVFKTPEGELISEQSITIPMGGKFINVPSIYDGVRYSEDKIIDMLKKNMIEATSVHDSMEEAIEAAKSRSSKLLAKGGSMESQMKMFEGGGLYQEGGTTDPVSGNEVPTGSLQEEVRDDIDAKLSEGEFVFPADVVRYIGLENLMKLRQKAKEGLSKMDDMGQMGNSEEAVVDDDEEYNAEVDELIDSFDPNAPDEMEFAEGGAIPDVRIPEAPKYDIPGFQQPRYKTGAVKSYEDLMGTAGILPKYETKQYIGPNNDIISITFLNGRPVNPIPEGYRPYKGELVKPEVQAPTVVKDRGGDGGNPEAEAERERQYEQYKANAATLAAYDPKFAETWNQDPAKTGKFTNLADMVMNSVNTAMGMTDAVETVAQDLGIDLGDYKNTGLSRLGGKYNVEAFTKNLNDRAEDLSSGDDTRANERAAQVREDFRAREEEEEAAFREGRTGRRTPSSVPTSTPKGVSVSVESAGAGRSSGPLTEDQMADRGGWKGSDYDGDGQDDERDSTSGFDDPTSESYGELAKGGLLAPRTPRKPKAKQTTSTRGRGLARKK